MVKLNCTSKMIAYFVLLLVTQSCFSFTDKKVIRLYYESLCPDSVAFVKNQLSPAINLLGKYIKIKYIPWGIANSTNTGGFKCQHGSKECLGNTIQECAFHYMENKSEKEKADYLLCEMTELWASKGSYKCVEQSAASEAKVKSCANSIEGKQLQLISEKITKKLDPNFIPTVTFDGKFDKVLQDASIKDFIATLCTELDQPEECMGHYNRQALRRLLSGSGSLSKTLLE